MKSISKDRFFIIFKKDLGGFEAEAFENALNSTSEDVKNVKVEFPISEKSYFMPRDVVKTYAKWSQEVRKPEMDLIEYIKPNMRNWVLRNRSSMCKRIKKALQDYQADQNGLTIVWEIEYPDKVPEDLARKYLEYYNNV